MNPRVFDNPEGGIDFELDVGEGLILTVCLTDKAAQQLVKIVSNKLAARGIF